MSAPTWKSQLADTIPPDLAREIDAYETELTLRRQGRMEEKLFAEARLRRGVYGQRYDNGQRHDGLASQRLAYPCGELTKGPSTVWDAPGMMRIKIPLGALTTVQMEALAEVAEEYADGVLHVTTRQDVQLHFVHIEDTPDLMRRLGAVGITTREACGNSVRNVTACPLSGVCADEPFDVTPYAHACARFLLGHDDTQGFGRKFKIAFSGCRERACALTAMHDLGCIAATRLEQGRLRRGFELYVGGGLGAVPHQAKLLEPFLIEEELLPTAQAICRVFARLGEKKNRQRARIKFLVARLGLEELRRLVLAERAALPPDPRWTAFLGDLAATDERPLHPPSPLGPGPHPDGFEGWRRTNVAAQRQPGYVVATVHLPLGDLTADQLRALAALARRHCGDTVRATVEQDLALRWVAEGELPALYAGLAACGLGRAGAGTMADVTSCPGTDTCKLGIASSRGLAAELSSRLEARGGALDPAIEGLRIKASGCFNACGQHHLADLGFLGVARTVAGRRVPHFQVVLGGQQARNGGAYGLAIGAVPSRRIPEVVDRLTARFVAGRAAGESFQGYIQRTGKAALRADLADLMEVPPYAEDPGFYADWGDPREYTIGDLGVGECAGEVVSPAEFGLAAAEREAFEAQLALERGAPLPAARGAYRAMLTAARALVRLGLPDLVDEPQAIVTAFRTRLVEPGLFADPFAGDKFAHYLLRLHEQPLDEASGERAHHLIEEAGLFIEAAHGCHDRLRLGAPA